MLTRFDNPAIAAAAVLFACGSAGAQQFKVALCGATSSSNADCQWTDPQARLLATGLFSAVDIINVMPSGGGTPTLQQLGQYDALLCWTNSTPANNVTWGNVLADYVDQGGGVVVAVFANSALTTGRNIGGRWQLGYEVILDQGGNASGLATLGTVHQPGHPVMAGVAAFSGGTSSFRPTATALEVGSTLVASWSDGKVLVAQGAMPNRVDLGFFPPSSTCTATYWTGAGDLLMANALKHVAAFAAYHTYGAGCPGTLGVPTLAALGGSRPVAGGFFQARVNNAPFGVALMVLGFSDDQSGGIPLPLDLSLINMPGCSLLAEIGSSEFIAGAPPTADWSLSIPLVAAFLGVNFFNQAAVFDTGVNPMDLTVTNGGRARIGF